MAEHSLYPAFVVFDYQSAYGFHKMTIPTREYVVGSGAGEFLNWNEVAVAADDMVEALAAKLKVMYKDTANFALATVYTKETPEALPLPRVSIELTAVGTSTDTSSDKATQRTYTFRSLDFNHFKLVLLDTPISSFERVVSGFSSAENDIFTILTLEDWAWQARDGARIETTISLTCCLNKRLRREYRMA